MKVNHHSKNGITIAVDRNIALLNVDKNSKTIRIDLKNTENQIYFLSIHDKKIKTYQTRFFTVIRVQGNHSQIIRITIDDNRLIEITIAEDLQIQEIHKNFHKTDTADQIAKIASIELITQGQTQTEVIA